MEYKNLSNLCNIERALYHETSDRKENDAEHMYLMTALYLKYEHELLAKYPNLDAAKVMRMIAVHDIPEALAGDTWYLATPADKAAKRKNELLAASILFQNHAPLFLLWQEYEMRLTLESQIVKKLDILQAVLANELNRGRNHIENKTTFDKEFNFCQFVKTYGEDCLTHAVYDAIKSIYPDGYYKEEENAD